MGKSAQLLIDAALLRTHRRGEEDDADDDQNWASTQGSRCILQSSFPTSRTRPGDTFGRSPVSAVRKSTSQRAEEPRMHKPARSLHKVRHHGVACEDPKPVATLSRPPNASTNSNLPRTREFRMPDTKCPKTFEAPLRSGQLHKKTAHVQRASLIVLRHREQVENH